MLVTVWTEKDELFPEEGWKTQEKENSVDLGIEKGIAWKEPMERAQAFLLKKLKIHAIRWSKNMAAIRWESLWSPAIGKHTELDSLHDVVQSLEAL